MKISSIDSALYQVPLAILLSDSTHGEMPFFELITVRIFDDEGREGLGYTYTVGVGGLAIHALIDRYLKPDLLGQDPSRIEHLWNRMWWRLHYSGRGGSASFAISAVDIALWDLAGKGKGCPSGDCWVAITHESRSTQEASISISPSTLLRSRPGDFWPGGLGRSK